MKRFHFSTYDENVGGKVIHWPNSFQPGVQGRGALNEPIRKPGIEQPAFRT